MIKVTVTNLVNGLTFHGKFETQAEAEAWVSGEEVYKSFGEPAHQKNIAELGQEPVLVDVPAEYNVEYIEYAVDQEKVNAEALAYLRKTDWYVVRALDNGTPVPDDIKAARQAARERVIV